MSASYLRAACGYNDNLPSYYQYVHTTSGFSDRTRCQSPSTVLLFTVDSATLDIKSARTLYLSRCPINDNEFAREDSARQRRAYACLTIWRPM
ncbi:hypothetical protein PILCRDRAFT_826190 [Piloderma croceum F 1598]|uniref:Uncharacterized protein n=1 Tax=Piloderma croceum (strain F 1598) TaxID=765440 RepID=A0A0C3ART9_PILCF|nr:hypothetical protein PILCRDRAFT_826190 [Piloderma croceum F 1598]